jgi:serine/threonine protein kinase
MEYFELGDLQRHLVQPLPESDGRHITRQILEGLQYMHANDFVHRDLKPSVRFRPGRPMLALTLH